MLLKSESNGCCGCDGDEGNKGGWLVADFIGEGAHTYLGVFQLDLT